LKSFEKKKMVVKKRSAADGRALNLALTALGEKEFLNIDQAASTQVNTAFANLSEDEYQVLIASMKTIKAILKSK
jgi:DNA-binding MarR family transcriptional regulator